ncbi:MAG: hypothetical protein PHE24_01450 [Patescibacteria group bacterium]|nr:hypothetical protein [Patescibacteria group bacterium]
MAQKSPEEIEGNIEEKKIRTKQFNKFFSDYFNWIVGGVVVAIFIIGFFVLLLPKYGQTVDYLNISNQQEILDASAKRDELSKIQQLLTAYNKIDKQYIDKVNAIAPVIKNKEELFSELNYLVSVNQLFLQSISLSSTATYQDQNIVPIAPQEKAISGSLETVNIVLSVKGTTYESFKNLLSDLENNLRLMDVLSIKFSPSGQTTSLIINAYYSKN